MTKYCDTVLSAAAQFKCTRTITNAQFSFPFLLPSDNSATMASPGKYNKLDEFGKKLDVLVINPNVKDIADLLGKVCTDAIGGKAGLRGGS